MAKILIADDDPVMVKLYEFALKKSGHVLVVCREGLSVPERAQESKPDMAIFDLMLPGLSGKELIDIFKADDDLKRIPIVVITAQGKDSVREELMQAGAYEVFTKPFSPSLLNTTVSSLVG